MSHKSTQSDNPLPKELLLTIKNSSTKHKKDKLKSFFFSTTDHSWQPIQEDVNLKSMEDQAPDPDIKNLTDDKFYKSLEMIAL